MADAPQLLFAEEEQAEECRFQKEGEDAFHGEGLSDHAAGGARKLRPVGAELEFHGNTGDHTESKVDAEDFCPEARGAIVVLITGAQGHGLQNDDEQGKAHGELREEIVERDREGEMKPMHVKGRIHANTSL